MLLEEAVQISAAVDNFKLVFNRVKEQPSEETVTEVTTKRLTQVGGFELLKVVKLTQRNYL